MLSARQICELILTSYAPTWLSQMGFTAAVSRILQSVETTGHAQLTWDDAIYFDHCTRMAMLMFDEHGARLLPEPSRKQCDAVRMYNWIERAPSRMARRHQSEMI